MNTYFTRFFRRPLRYLMIFFVLTSLVNSAYAAKNYQDDIRTLTDKYWADYAAGLKKITDQKNDHASALLCTQLRSSLSPRYNQLKSKTQAWKKSHTDKEYLDLVEWTQKNQHFAEAMKYRMAPELLMRMAQNTEFMEAYTAMIHDLPADANTTLN